MVNAKYFGRARELGDPLRKFTSVQHVMAELGLEELLLPIQERLYDVIMQTLIEEAQRRAS